ncbi:hypothetical protein AMTRI_Chr05g65490 [Amborella trichopoda]
MCNCFHIQICSWKYLAFSKSIFFLWNMWGFIFWICSILFEDQEVFVISKSTQFVPSFSFLCLNVSLHSYPNMTVEIFCL